jgi:glucose-1-phosphatase
MKINLKGIKNIIFDLGGVILNINPDAAIDSFCKLGFQGDLTDGKLAYSDEIFYNLQTGSVAPDEFIERIKTILKNPLIKNQEIDAAWCSMIGDIPPSRVKTIQKLRKNYKIFLFSNTNKIHVDYLEKKFRNRYGSHFASMFDDVYYSHEIHLAKPDLKSFQKVIELSGIEPEETLFIDDIKENIEGAAKAGLTTYWLNEGREITDLFN